MKAHGDGIFAVAYHESALGSGQEAVGEGRVALAVSVLRRPRINDGHSGCFEGGGVA